VGTVSDEDESPQLQWWKVLERQAEEKEEFLEEQQVLLASFAYKREEDSTEIAVATDIIVMVIVLG
jgi:hypothetical protein